MAIIQMMTKGKSTTFGELFSARLIWLIKL
jgi:hypothetical protein